MNVSNLPNSENEESENWKSWTPEEYLSILLHELRTPIVIIKGYTAILADEKQKDIHPKAIEGISHAADRLEILWKDMADYNRVLINKS